jgi:hypothetical protein
MFLGAMARVRSSSECADGSQPPTYELIHFLTTQADTYMNEEFQTTSAAEDLA